MLQKVLKLFQGREPKRAKPPARTQPRYRAVELRPRNNPEACAAIRGLRGQRFLMMDAPTLPLAECDAPQRCDCRYLRYDDRRSEIRRDADHGIVDRLPERVKKEQRQGNGRRKTD